MPKQSAVAEDADDSRDQWAQQPAAAAQDPAGAGISPMTAFTEQLLYKPEYTEAMGAGVDTRDDGQGKANGAGLSR